MKSSIPAPGMWRVLESSLLVLHSRQRGKGLKGGCLSLRVGRNNRNSNPNFGAGNCSPTAESTAESWEIRGQSGSNDSCSESENSPFRPLSTPAERVRIPPFPPSNPLIFNGFFGFWGSLLRFYCGIRKTWLRDCPHSWTYFSPTSYCGILRFYCGILDGRHMGSANELAAHYNRGMSKPFERGIHENAGHVVDVCIYRSICSDHLHP